MRHTLLTGVSRCVHLNVFSGFNNLRDVSLAKGYAALCGIAEAELLVDFGEGVRRLAAEQGKTWAQTYEKLEAMREGYRFSPSAEERVHTLL